MLVNCVIDVLFDGDFNLFCFSSSLIHRDGGSPAHEYFHEFPAAFVDKQYHQTHIFGKELCKVHPRCKQNLPQMTIYLKGYIDLLN